ncbi:MAG TPA: hypothetical protein DCY48_00780 [Candidatus Magasanikbacteria bacterium]|nr:hypothetical protein [Candidatus Magasanikbacteria bacterium]
MTDSKKSLMMHLPIPKWLPFAFLLVSFLGFLDATYLTVAHYGGVALVCGVFQGCDVVTTSLYATVFGIPVALLGAVYYLDVFFFTLLYIDTKKPLFFLLAAGWTVAGLFASAWFMYLQLFVIRQICIYCIGSAATSALLFACAVFFVWHGLKQISNPHPGEPPVLS